MRNTIHFKRFGFLIGLALLFFISAIVPSRAVTPMEYYNTLVAGGDEKGFHDGTFISARFSYPAGLAFDDSGNKLYVADPGNQRIRVIHLDRNNAVETVAGKGTPGATDGPVSVATFKGPTKLAMLSGNRLAVFDAGSGFIRLIDLQEGTVSTAVKGVNVQDMVYRPQDDSLYFSEPGVKKIEKMNAKSLEVSTVLSDNPRLPSPGALCLWNGNLCAADNGLSMVYEIRPADKPLAKPSTVAGPVSLLSVGNVKDALALASTDGSLYALQKGGHLVKVGLPDSNMVRLPTPWGFLFNNHDHNIFIWSNDPQGFVVSPGEPRKFYISAEYSIVSVKDYNFEKRWPANEWNYETLTEFDYPAKKPPRTFRILSIGDSRNSLAFPVFPDTDLGLNEGADPDLKVNTYSKQLEFLLNTEASLRNSIVHFEVLNLTRRGASLGTFAYDEVPACVKKYDIDLVIGITSMSGYRDYYEKQLTPEGIPIKSLQPPDPEYLLKPLSERAKTRASKDFLKQCKQLKIPFSENKSYPDGWYDETHSFYNEYPSLENDLIEMTGQRLGLLDEKLNSMRTSWGNSPQLVLFYVPCAKYRTDDTASFWEKVCDHYHLKFLNLTEPYNALKVGYFPTNGERHFSNYGNELIAQLLKYYFQEKKYVPFDTLETAR